MGVDYGKLLSPLDSHVATENNKRRVVRGDVLGVGQESALK